MIKAIHHTAISVRDLDNSIHFYRDILGMDLEWRRDHQRSEPIEKMVGMKDMEISFALVSGWGGKVELIQYHSPRGKPFPEDRPQCDHGIIHMAFQVEDIDGLYKKLLDGGVQFNCPPQVLRPGVKATFFHDPNGVALEMIQYS